MRGLVIYAWLLTGLFYFSEGKPCPEKTRPHKTRCDAYYKCRALASNSHVWVPVKCHEGLVYETSLGGCVLPGDDWECITPSELNSSTPASSHSQQQDADILIVNDMDEAGLLLREPSPHHGQHHDDGTVEIVLDSTLSSEEHEEQEQQEEEGHDQQSSIQSDEGESSSLHHFDSSGDGELMEVDSPPPPPPEIENREDELELKHEHRTPDNQDMEQLGDVQHRPAVEQLEAEIKQAAGVSELAKPGSHIHPQLTAHLQRLSQLIDGLQQKYQKTDKPQADMRPDQLNAFLAHFDIKNRYEMMNPMEATTATATSTTTPEPSTYSSSSSTTKLPPQANTNKTRLQEHLSKHRLEPETKLILSNALPFSGGTGQGYANSQIVVNRPEGSVMFALPPPQYGMSQEQMGPAYSPQQGHSPGHSQSHEYGDHEPKISEDTLKTVLELSKQMIAAQNVPKVLPNPGFNGYYAQPILQPVYLSAHGNPFQQYYAPQPMMPSHYMHHKKHSSGGSSSGNGGYNKPSTTIIHNNVIPVHLSSTSSGEKEVLDTYGHSLGVYPSLDQSKHQSNDYMTTARPTPTLSSQYPSPFAAEYTLTTPRPFQEQPSAATVSTYYTPSPHLSEQNVHRIFQATESYPTVNMPRPMDMSMFPSGHLEPGQVGIRPNSQKIESMEMDGPMADEMIKASSYGNVNGNGNGNSSPHVLTYSSDGGGSSGGGGGGGSGGYGGMSHQLAPTGAYLDQSYNQQQQQQQQQQHHHHPYMPRPTMSSSMYSDADGNMELSMFSNLSPYTPEKIKYGAGSSGSPSPNGQLVNFNGNFISLDVFQKSILPLMTKNPAAMSDLSNVEVITCQTGVRQPNQTDCTRYFVCSKKDGKVLSYSCPPYTGFNKQTRICDAQTYAQCGSVMPAFNGYTIDNNRRLQMEAIKMLSEAKRRQEAALKAQNIASLLQQYGNTQQGGLSAGISANIEQDSMDSAYMVNLPDMSPATTTARPIIIQASSSNSIGSSVAGSVSAKKRKYYCKEGDKIPDQTSISSYFVCYKNAQGQMKGHKMTCSTSLLFCPRTLMCTLASKCQD
ncbi:uncharacterized protein LOC111078256 [Drosophila obscura]|uniref:uncharacterized protein LOC111078256 n=1 Tax=Drosophila obscura TaxID=7282 RepID=UPI001BB22353|nr:uncharacterized protein LOC111078256 [Drosophila obscura]